MIVGQRRLGGKFVTIRTRGLVAMMPVGDEDVPVGHRGRGRGDDRRIGHRPDAVNHADLVGRLDRMAAGGEPIERAQDGRVGIGVRPEDRRQVRPAGPGELEPVELGGPVGLLVGVDPAGAERFEAEPPDQPPPRVGSARRHRKSDDRHTAPHRVRCAAPHRGATSAASARPARTARHRCHPPRPPAGRCGRRPARAARQAVPAVPGRSTSYGGAVTAERSPTRAVS